MNIRICLELELSGQAAQDCQDIGKEFFIEDILSLKKNGYRPMDITLVFDETATQAINTAYSQGFGKGFKAGKNQDVKNI